MDMLGQVPRQLKTYDVHLMLYPSLNTGQVYCLSPRRQRAKVKVKLKIKLHLAKLSNELLFFIINF